MAQSPAVAEVLRNTAQLDCRSKFLGLQDDPVGSWLPLVLEPAGRPVM